MLKGSNSVASNSALIPLVRIAPRYPRDALISGKTGFVTITLTVDEDGKVIDAIISESRPPRIFDRAAIQAVDLGYCWLRVFQVDYEDILQGGALCTPGLRHH